MGKIVNNEYELLDQLGQGGMGVVYKARHIHFGDTVAIKRLWEQFSNNAAILELFLNEGKILRSLHHRNIVEVSGLFAFEGSHYIVMEYIEGRTLSEIIKRETGPIQRYRAVKLFKQMLEGVAYIHNQPKTIIHRDLKPLNILVTADDTVKITDFGIAKALETGGQSSTAVKGTPVYMSPEQIMDPKSVDIRTDIYSLGMTFYEMLCGRTPFRRDTAATPTAVYAAIMNDEVPPLKHYDHRISDDLSDFVMKAIHKDRNQRFADASEMLWGLEKLEMTGATTVQDEPNKKGVGNKDKTFIKWLTAFALIVFLSIILFSVDLSGIFTPEGMALVEGGNFTMGSKDGDSDEKPVHQVTVSSFLMGKTEVTQSLWESVMGNNPSRFNGSNRPIESVSWNEVVEFCNKLSEKEGLKKAYSGSGDNIRCDFSANGYRLPTEAEWEFAASGGKKRRGYRFSGSNDLNEVGWYENNSGNQTQEVGMKQPNELGIYDMSGNVWEWCWDWYGEYSSSSNSDPRGPDSGSVRVLRGGSWKQLPGYSRVANRYSGSGTPDTRSDLFGFRLVRTK